MHSIYIQWRAAIIINCVRVKKGPDPVFWGNNMNFP